ncbi:MAG: hypothetical protein ACJ716_10780 [Marmoricola sp.]
MGRRPVLIAVTAVLVSIFTPSPAGAASIGLVPYYAPPFADACTVHAFGEGEIPDLNALPDDPLCVDYAKRNITVSNGGAVAFLLAEPARFALAGTKCQYWQQDHWSVQLAPGMTPVIRWDGSYWWDLGTGQIAARLTGLTIAGQPATIARAAAYIAPYSPALAAYFLRYGTGGDGGALNLGLPLNPLCR